MLLVEEFCQVSLKFQVTFKKNPLNLMQKSNPSLQKLI